MDETTPLLPKLVITAKEQFTGPDFTIISGFESNVDLRMVLLRLRKALKCDGYIKDREDHKAGDTIYLIGDHRTRSKQILLDMGLRVNPKAN
jgi:translation initiation factor 1 (eIF-1/SUI1)